MSFIKTTLKGSKAAVVADIKGLMWNGEAVYPDYPEGYERSFGPFDRFIVTEPRQEVVSPGEYAEDGTQTKAPVLGDWVSHLVLPLGYDTSGLQTLASE